MILQAGIQAVSARVSLLDKLPDGGADAGKISFTAALDIVLEMLSPGGTDDAEWLLARNSNLSELVRIALRALAHYGAMQPNLDVLRAELQAWRTAQESLCLDEFGEHLSAKFERPKRKRKPA